MMLGSKTFQSNRKLDVTRADNVLDLKIGELGIESQLLDDASVFPRCQFRIILRLRTSNYHFARGKDECGGFWIANAHNDSSETLANKSANENVSTSQ